MVLFMHLLINLQAYTIKHTLHSDFVQKFETLKEFK
jgi:hypothetical protein